MPCRYALLVVDSATALYRTDYSGRGELSERYAKYDTVVSIVCIIEVHLCTAHSEL